MNVSETVKRITELQLCGSDSRAQSYNEGLKAAIHILESCEQPQLNENQQQVLGWLKDYYKENRPFTTAFGAIRNVASKRWAFIKQNLTEDQQEHVLEVFSRWTLEQEEE